jgi:hypothetical protein
MAEEDVYEELRELFLANSAEELGLDPAVAGLPVWGVLTEVGQPDGAATLVAIADGTTSLYRSSGGAIAGAGAAPGVAQASRALVAAVSEAIEHFTGAAGSVAGRPEMIEFVALTPAGPRGVSGQAQQLMTPDHPLGKVFALAARALGAILELEAAMPSGEGPTG